MAKKKRILVVDDEPNIRLLVKNMLGNRYNVVEAGDGNEAVTQAEKEKPDVVLLDILMPGKDGFTTCNQLKANKATKDIPVVMVTALQHKLDEKLALSLKADGYLRKPFTSDDLLNVIRSALSAKR